MRKAMRVLIAGVLFGTALLAGAQEPVRVQVPFDFQVSDQTLPAGTYTVGRVFEHDSAALRISGGPGMSPVSFLVILDSPTKVGAGLSFRRYGDSYFLSGVTTSNGKFALTRSRSERQMSAKGAGTELSVGGGK